MKSKTKSLIVIMIMLVFLVGLAACEKETVTISFETNGGGTIEDIQIAKNAKELNLPMPTKAGYSFEKWYMDDDFQREASLENIMDKQFGDIILYAKWAKNVNTLIFDANGGQGQMSDMQIATEETAELTLNQFEKEGYVFAGWSQSQDGEAQIEDGGEYTMGTDSEYTLFAVWATEIIITFDANGGNGQMDDLKTGEGMQVQLEENQFTKDGHVFSGWALTSEGEKVYKDEDTISSEQNITLYAKWIDPSGFIEMVDESSFYFGEYPQTLADNEALEQMPAQPDSQGYYIIGSDKYVKITATPHETPEGGSIFQNNEDIVYGEEYFFKVEPIKWRILQEDDGGYFVVADMILDKGIFGENNNWEQSDIRSWLNDEFINEAFSENQSLIIDNRQNTTPFWTTSDEEKQHVDTEDKVFLLSHSEITNEDYGFVDNEQKVAYVSDYANAIGVWTGLGDLVGNPAWQRHTGMYLLRSGERYPFQGKVDSVRYFGASSEAVSPEDENFGIRPAMYINKY